jgi:LuxR family maltose regulon positive regulatory protein
MRESHQQAAISDGLLRTKLAPPRANPADVPRPALLARLDAGLARKLMLISSPAGFGKTTLLAGWLASQSSELKGLSSELSELEQTQNSKLITHTSRVAWLALDAGDNDLVRFWRYVLNACRAWDAAIGRESLATLRIAQQPSLEQVLVPFINELAVLPSRHVLVIDDYHTITAADVHASLAYLIEHLPDTVHVVVATRGEPALPLARLRARNELAELGAEDLRFSHDEIRAFIEQALRVALPPAVVLQLEERTEGWVAALRLIALAFQPKAGTSDLEQFLAGFGGHRHMIEYLVSEVLAVQPPEIQSFLLHTSLLTKLTGSLCDAVLGGETFERSSVQTFKPSDAPASYSQRVLEQLERMNLFLVPLDDQRHWYRYHPLFAEAMRRHAERQLPSGDLRGLHERASAWYEARGMLGDAIDEALAAGQEARAAALIEQVFDQSAFNELYTLRRWVEQMARETLSRHPLLCFAYANAILFTSDRYAPATARAVEQWARLAEAAWRELGDTPRLGQIAALRAMVAFWQDDRASTFAHSRQALELLPEHDLLYRSVALLYIGYEALQAGDLDTAQRVGLEARTLYEVIQNPHGTLAALHLFGELYYQRGELDQAEQCYRRIYEQAVGGAEMLDDRGYALAGLGAIAYERDELELAEQQSSQAIELAKQRHTEALLVQATLVWCRARCASGDTAAGQRGLQALAIQARNPAALREIACAQARLALAAGDLDLAQRCYAAALAHGAEESRLEQEHTALLAAQLRLAQGDPAGALQLLEHWRPSAAAQGRARAEIAILTVQALAEWGLGRRAQAEQALARALHLGQPRALRRIFLDMGAPLAGLLQSVAPNLGRRPLVAYAAGLLHALAPGAPAADQAGLPLLEPLSPQEQRVLRLILAGQPNSVIARELVVSPNTVKTHVKNIYRKLNVRTREEAQAAARELRLY